LPVKRAGANRPRTKSAWWRCGARLAGQFPRPGKRKHGGATNGRSYSTVQYSWPPWARETPLARYLCYIVRGYMLEVVGAHSLPIPFYQDRRQTSDVESNLDPRPNEFSSPLFSRIVQPAMAPSSAAIVGLAPPPPGVTPNFVHPESIAYHITITLAVCLVLCTCVLLLRLYTRYFITRMLGVDDCKCPNSRERF
jgi:hypothetical protein